MSHTVSISPSTITLPSFDPGTSVNFVVNVNGATQPETTAAGLISVGFNGDTASAPLAAEFTGQVVPTIAIDSLDPRLAVSFGEPTQIAGNAWQFQATLTVV